MLVYLGHRDSVALLVFRLKCGRVWTCKLLHRLIIATAGIRRFCTFIEPRSRSLIGTGGLSRAQISWAPVRPRHVRVIALNSLSMSPIRL